MLVKLAATSVNPIDWKIRRGDRKATMALQFPVIPGRDVAGEVSALGNAVAGFQPGQKVMALATGALGAVGRAALYVALTRGAKVLAADTVSGEVIAKLLPKLRRGGTLGSVLGTPKAAEGRDIRVEAFMAKPDAARLARMAQAVQQGRLAIPIARTFRLSEAAEATQLAETGHPSGKVACSLSLPVTP